MQRTSLLRCVRAAPSIASVAFFRACPPSHLARSFSSGTHPDFAPKAKQAPASTAAPPALREKVQALLASKPVVLFMKGSVQQPMCGFSAKAVQLLQRNGVSIHGEDVLKNEALRAGMKEISQWPTFPQLYIKGEFVGGVDIMSQMENAGELKDLLKDVPKVTPAP